MSILTKHKDKLILVGVFVLIMIVLCIHFNNYGGQIINQQKEKFNCECKEII